MIYRHITPATVPAGTAYILYVAGSACSADNTDPPDHRAFTPARCPPPSRVPEVHVMVGSESPRFRRPRSRHEVLTAPEVLQACPEKDVDFGRDRARVTPRGRIGKPHAPGTNRDSGMGIKNNGRAAPLSAAE